VAREVSWLVHLFGLVATCEAWTALRYSLGCFYGLLTNIVPGEFASNDLSTGDAPIGRQTIDGQDAVSAGDVPIGWKIFCAHRSRKSTHEAQHARLLGLPLCLLCLF